MPKAVIFARVAFSTHDESPRGLLRRLLGRVRPAVRAVLSPRVAGGWYTGEEWFLKYWPLLADAVKAGAIAVFTNEWFANKQPPYIVDGFCLFFSQLIDACKKYTALWGIEIKCTVGDFSVGTPGMPEIPEEAYDVPAMQDLITKVEENGFWWNMHLYDLHSPGLVPRKYTLRRTNIIREGHPHLNIIGGELANDPQDVGNRDGLFGGSRTLDMMREFIGEVDEPGCWWLWCNPAMYKDIAEARWDLDDVSTITRQYFDLVIEVSRGV